MLFFLLWIAEGAIASWLAGMVMSTEGRDHVMNVVMGMAGGLAGGFLLSAAGLVQGKMIYTSLTAALGAVILTVLSRYGGGSREYGSTD